MGDCIFCGIIEGRLPASVVYRDDVVIAFMDISPVNTGHVLVVPLLHCESLSDLAEEIGMRLFRVTMRLQKATRKSGVRCEGINLFLADGEAAFQEVFHTHMHIIPRFKGDEFRIQADWSKKPPHEELDEIATSIKDAYRATTADGLFTVDGEG